MSKLLTAQILTPTGALFSGEVEAILVPGSEGAFEILHQHAPIVSVLGIGKIRVTKPGGEVLLFAVSGGFVEASDNLVTVLAEKATAPEDIHPEDVQKQRSEVKERLKETTQGRESLEKEIRELDNLLALSANS